MSSSGLTYFDQHFLLSNRILQFLIRIRPNQSSNEQLLLLCTVTFCVSPMILQQFYQLFTSNYDIQSAVKVLETMIPGLFVVYCYFNVYFGLLTKISVSFLKMKLLYVHFKLDYELLANEDELNIMKKYTKRSKLYVYLIIVLINLYIISITFPSIINVFLYISGLWDDIHLTLPFPVNNVLNAGLAYYSLLIYQILALFIVGVIGSICYSLYWVMMQHVCSQFSVIIWKMQQPFKNDQRNTENNWCIGTIQEEWNWIIDLIQCYTRVIELIDLINDYCKITYLIAVSISMLLVFFNFLYMFQLSTVLQSPSETIKCCIYMAGSVSTIYISFLVGQLVMDHSNDAFVEMCQIPFYMLSIKTQKLLLFLLTRSMLQSEISIGGIYVASHETFASLIQKAFSFATVYYSML